MQGDFSLVRRAAMLKEINTLPGPQRELALQDRNSKLHAGEGGADVSRHIIGAFVRVPILAVLWRYVIEKRLEVSAHVPRGVLLYEQSS
jgi:hypothetical protein